MNFKNDETRTRLSSYSCSSSLDSREHNRNRSCGRWTLRGELQPHTRYTRLGCKKWTCTCCGPKKVKRLRRAIIEQASSKDLRRFLTLTVDPSACSPEESIKYIRDCWNKFRTYLKRRYGSRISFISIVELQKSRYAHLHILVDRFLPQAWVSEAWQAVGGGRIVFITHVDIHRVAGYLSKYLTKDLLLAGFRSRTRRYTTSRDITLFSRSSDGTWVLLKVPLEVFEREFRERIIQTSSNEEGGLQWFEILPP